MIGTLDVKLEKKLFGKDHKRIERREKREKRRIVLEEKLPKLKSDTKRVWRFTLKFFAVFFVIIALLILIPTLLGY